MRLRERKRKPRAVMGIIQRYDHFQEQLK
jgi:hypothetical protein